MVDGANLRFDIEALFKHLAADTEYDAEQEKQWDFAFRSEDIAKLSKMGKALSNEFDVDLQEEVPTIEDGKEFMDVPMLSVSTVGALSEAEVKALAARFEAMAKKEGVKYDGVSSYDVIDEEEMFGWMDVESAVWRLRHYTDTGLPANADMPWVFAVVGPENVDLEAVGAGLDEKWYTHLEMVEDEEGPVLVVHCEGKNDEKALTARYGEIERVVKGKGAELLGVLFFVAGEGDEDEGDEDED